MLKKFQKIMTAVTFAEAGEYDAARSLMESEIRDPKIAERTATNRVSLVERAQQYMEAITFAEEGEHEYARATLESISPAHPKAMVKSILVLGKEDTFADYLVNYALDMAERFDYEIVAVNALPMSRKTRVLSGFADEIGERFENNALNAGAAFQRRAEERGIHFSQEIKLMSEQKALRALHKERNNIEFVLTEPELTPAESTAECYGSVCVCAFVE